MGPQYIGFHVKNLGVISALFPDAEFLKNNVQNIFDIYTADDFTEGAGCHT